MTTVEPRIGSPTVDPLQVVTDPVPVIGVQAVKNCSPPGLAVVEIWIVGIPASALAGATPESVKLPEPVLVQLPATPPVTTQTCPTAVAHATPGVPLVTRVGTFSVRVGVAPVGVAVGVAVIGGVLL